MLWVVIVAGTMVMLLIVSKRRTDGEWRWRWSRTDERTGT
jgi:hypothetical protein